MNGDNDGVQQVGSKEVIRPKFETNEKVCRTVLWYIVRRCFSAMCEKIGFKNDHIHKDNFFIDYRYIS